MMFTEKVQRVAEAEFAGRVGKDNYVEYEFNKYQGRRFLSCSLRVWLMFPQVPSMGLLYDPSLHSRK